MPDNEDIEKDIEKYSALETLKSSPGGALLVQSYIEDILNVLDSLASGYRKLTHIEMIAYCAELSEKLDVVRTLTRARANNDAAKDALKETLAAEPES